MIFLAGIGGIVPLLIFIVFAIVASWLKKKAEKEQAEDYRDLPRGPQPPPARRKSWEEELRDALENRPAPPPIRREVPPPIDAPAPTPPLQEEQDRGIEVYLPPPQPKIEPVFQPLHGLAESGQRYAQAAALQHRVGQHLADVTRHTGVLTSVERHAVSPQTQEAMNLVRDRRNVRAAILASVIVGPPRALDAV